MLVALAVLFRIQTQSLSCDHVCIYEIINNGFLLLRRVVLRGLEKKLGIGISQY